MAPAKKAAPKERQKVKIETTAEAAAQIAHAAEREAQLIDHLANDPDDFAVQTWEFLLPWQKRNKVARVEKLRAGKCEPATLFDVVALSLN